jgi:hypothetical protein
MNLPKTLVACCGVLALSLPAFAGVNVNSPANNADVTSPVKLSASASTCSSKPVTGIGYSIDSSSNTTSYPKQSMTEYIPLSTGPHTLKVKAWSSGSSCVVDVVVNVKSSTSSTDIPSYAQTVSHIEALSGWRTTHDTGGKTGTSSGTTDLVSSPSRSGLSRRFVTKFTDAGDERYSHSFSDDVTAKNFFYDGWIYLTKSASQIGNIELDLNQVMADGRTVLAGVQCDGYSGNWAYTVNTGTSRNPAPHWKSISGTTCNPRKLTQNTWHHIQFSFSRDDSGYVTYKSVWLDGNKSTFNDRVFGAASLGWGDTIQTQFQIDGYGASGTPVVYLDDLRISRW